MLSVYHRQMPNMWNTISSLCWDAVNKTDEHSRATVTAIVSIFAVLWFIRAVTKPKHVASPPPPGPGGLPLVGYLPFLGAELHRKFDELSRLYGPIYKFWLGTKLCVVISSTSLVKEVVRDQDTVFANHEPTIAAQVFSYGGADVVFTPYGDDWRKLRKVFVREMLSKANLDSSFTLRKEEVKKSIRSVYNKMGSPVNLGELASVTVVSAMISMVWGDTLQGDEGANFAVQFKSLTSEQMVLMAKPNVSDFFPILARFDLQGIERKAKRIQQSFDKILDSAIGRRIDMAKDEEEGKAKFEQRKDFLQILLDLRKDGGENSITMNQLKALLMDIIVGGADTTATMVEWVMAELLQHPETMRKVSQELTEVVGLDNLVDESHLPRLQYLKAVIKESFRLHPPIPLLVPHCPSQSTIIGGYHVPKGATVFLNIWTIHKDPKIWENPLEFKPERFLSDHSKLDYSGNNFEYLPFGSGRRICAGLPLAERSLIFIVASFLHSYEWEVPKDVKLDFSDTYGLVTKKRSPAVAIPTARLSKFELYS